MLESLTGEVMYLWGEVFVLRERLKRQKNISDSGEWPEIIDE